MGQEEAGKFLVLIDSCRSPSSDASTIACQFDRARNHLAKLIYAQIADYSIASQEELLGAVERHRQALHLDGPNDFDWIFQNELIAEREGALYVDLVESEGELLWSAPSDSLGPQPVSGSVRLVLALLQTGLVSVDGLRILQDAWKGFDANARTKYSEWAQRTTAALDAYAASHPVGAGWEAAAGWVIELWPMPMVELDLSEVKVPIKDLAEQRQTQYDAWVAREFGPLGPEY